MQFRQMKPSPRSSRAEKHGANPTSIGSRGGRGEIAWLAPEPDISKAETHFEQALAIARQQQAKSWELRAAMSLARLWRDRGECVTARELLAGLYDWFREALETLDLQRARMLLAMLTAQAGLPIPHSEHVARGQNLRGGHS
jgi:hypothetical protein